MSATDIERRASALPDHDPSLPPRLADHALWVCFLNPEGLETFANARFDGSAITVTGATSLKDHDVSTIRVLRDGTHILPTGFTDEGEPFYMTMDQIVAGGVIPELAVASLTRRIAAQPHRRNFGSPIYPLMQLPPFKQ